MLFHAERCFRLCFVVVVVGSDVGFGSHKCCRRQNRVSHPRRRRKSASPQHERATSVVILPKTLALVSTLAPACAGSFEGSVRSGSDFELRGAAGKCTRRKWSLQVGWCYFEQIFPLEYVRVRPQNRNTFCVGSSQPAQTHG